MVRDELYYTDAKWQECKPTLASYIGLDLFPSHHSLSLPSSPQIPPLSRLAGPGFLPLDTPTFDPEQFARIEAFHHWMEKVKHSRADERMGDRDPFIGK